MNSGKAIDDKKQISFADKDARIMGKNGHFEYAYNPQISVDSEHQIIVGQHVSQNTNDQKEVKQALESIQENTGKLPDKMSVDNGYQSGDNLDAFEEAEIDAYVATNRGDKSHRETLEDSERPLVKADFDYDKQSDCFTCPGGQSLPLKTKIKAVIVFIKVIRKGVPIVNTKHVAVNLNKAKHEPLTQMIRKNYGKGCVKRWNRQKQKRFINSVKSSWSLFLSN